MIINMKSLHKRDRDAIQRKLEVTIVATICIYIYIYQSPTEGGSGVHCDYFEFERYFLTYLNQRKEERKNEENRNKNTHTQNIKNKR